MKTGVMMMDEMIILSSFITIIISSFITIILSSPS